MPVWEGREHKWAAGPSAAAPAAGARSSGCSGGRSEELRRGRSSGYPGPPRPDRRAPGRAREAGRLQPARSRSRTRSWTTVARFRPGSLPARALSAVDRHASALGRSRRSRHRGERRRPRPPGPARAQEGGGLLRRRGGAHLPARLGAPGAVRRPLRRQADPPSRPRHGARGRAPRARDPVPGGRQRPARGEPRRATARTSSGRPGSSTSGFRASSTPPAARSGSSAPRPRPARVIPNKAFQALACGTPLVTADTPGARELLADGVSALLVPPGEPEALAAAVRRLAGDAALAERIGEPRTRRLPGARERGRPRRTLARAPGGAVRVRAALWTAIAAFAAGFSALAVLRHEAFNSGRFDLGNMVQVVWSTAHGDPLRMTDLERRADLAARRPHRRPAGGVRPALARLAEPVAPPRRRRPSSSGSARSPCSGSLASTSARRGPRSVSRSPTSSIRRFSGSCWTTSTPSPSRARSCSSPSGTSTRTGSGRFAVFAVLAALTKEEIGLRGRGTRAVVRARPRARRPGC